MDTLRSNEKSQNYTGSISIFSGRPDPTWQVEEHVVEELEKIWNSLKSFSGSFPSPPILGYRGCSLECPDNQEWFAYDGVVTLNTKDGSESRIDKKRKFERLLISSSPEGILLDLSQIIK